MFCFSLATVAYSIMTTNESTDAETGERNASRRRQAEPAASPPTESPTAEGTDFQMVTFKENGMISKQNQNTNLHTHKDTNYLSKLNG